MKNPFIGPWRIIWMSDWDQDYVDMDVTGHFAFGPGGSGSFRFGMVQGQMDCKPDRRQSPRIEFTWNGLDEGDELTGRGYAEIVDGELRGRIYVHLGDESAFRAVKQIPSARGRKTAS